MFKKIVEGYCKILNLFTAVSLAVMVVLASLVTFDPSGQAPTSMPVLKVTPSASICATRRSMWLFSILKSGMP